MYFPGLFTLIQRSAKLLILDSDFTSRSTYISMGSSSKWGWVCIYSIHIRYLSTHLWLPGIYQPPFWLPVIYQQLWIIPSTLRGQYWPLWGTLLWEISFSGLMRHTQIIIACVMIETALKRAIWCKTWPSVKTKGMLLHKWSYFYSTAVSAVPEHAMYDAITCFIFS